MAYDGITLRINSQQQTMCSFLIGRFVLSVAINKEKRHHGIDDQVLKGIRPDAFGFWGAGFMKCIVCEPIGGRLCLQQGPHFRDLSFFQDQGEQSLTAMHQGRELGDPQGGKIHWSEPGKPPQVLLDRFEPEFFAQVQVFIEKPHVIGIIQSFLLKETGLAEEEGFQLEEVVLMAGNMF